MNEEGVRQCRSRGLDVVQGQVEDVDLRDGHFATILLSHVLEHIRAPVATLRKLRVALLPGGRVVIAVPNAGGLVARTAGRYWHGWDPPFHLTHFTPHTLATMLVEAGFEVASVRTRGYPDDITRSLAKMFKRPVTSLPLRAALLPGSWLLGKVNLGGEICAVGRRPVDRPP
jgi:SAM-dependent methyltransferase